MQRIMRALIALLVLPVLAGLLQFGPFAGPSQLSAGGGVIDPEVWEALQTSSEVEVIVQLVQPSGPLEEMTLDEFAQFSETKKANVLAKLAPVDFTLTAALEGLPGFAGRITASGALALEGHPDVLSVILDKKLYLALGESVPLIHADQVHAGGVTGAGIEVAVLDTGVDPEHDDLEASILSEACFLPQDECGPPEHPALDDNGHGTMVTGVLTSNGNNNIAPPGVAPDVGIHAWKIAGADGEANFSGVAAALRKALFEPPKGNPIEFLNLSLTDRRVHASGQCEYQDPEDNAVIDFALTGLRLFRGTILFAASGNSGHKWGMGYPACHPLVVSVGGVYDEDIGPSGFGTVCQDATTRPDKVTCWSQSSPDLDLLAPNHAIVTTAPGNQAFAVLGTSVAPPHAAGVAALLLEARPDLNPTTAPENQRDEAIDRLVSRLKLTGAPVFYNVTDPPPDHTIVKSRTTPRVDARVALLTDDGADFDGDGLTNGQELDGAASPKAALGTLFANPLAADTDQDGCADGRELGTNQSTGGQRNPSYFWDFADMPDINNVRNRAIGVTDVGRVVARYGRNDALETASINRHSDPLSQPPASGYHPAFDRGPALPGTNDWNVRAPDGAIALTDIVAVVRQFGHTCL